MVVLCVVGSMFEVVEWIKRWREFSGINRDNNGIIINVIIGCI